MTSELGLSYLHTRRSRWLSPNVNVLIPASFYTLAYQTCLSFIHFALSFRHMITRQAPVFHSTYVTHGMLRRVATTPQLDGDYLVVALARFGVVYCEEDYAAINGDGRSDWLHAYDTGTTKLLTNTLRIHRTGASME